LLPYASLSIWPVTIRINLRLVKFDPIHDVFAKFTRFD
jgi:hypothetical protein